MCYFFLFFSTWGWSSLTKFNFKFPTMCSKCYACCRFFCDSLTLLLIFSWFSFFFVKNLNTSVDDFFFLLSWLVYIEQSHSRKISKYFSSSSSSSATKWRRSHSLSQSIFSCLISCCSLSLDNVVVYMPSFTLDSI